MQDFAGKKILLGICGGIAAYKSAHLVRELTRLGAEVQVVMTASACEFITPLTMQALSGNAVRLEVFDMQAERAMGHIELARWADYLLIAPATANTLAKMAQGVADDLLTTLYLVSETPVFVCPAMNRSMWSHPATQANCELLRQRGVRFIGPENGAQACGEFGLGRMSEVDTILAALRLAELKLLLSGQKVMITAGSTQEAIDPVRYLSNHSSGKMGYALAEAARVAGAQVTLVSGAATVSPPTGVIFHCAQSASEMHELVMKLLEPGMLFIGCAAVADFSPEQVATQKIKKQQHQQMTLTLKKNADILSEVAASGLAACVVGFSAETEEIIAHATTKLAAKKLDMIIANEVGEGKGFGTDDNQVTVVTAAGQIELASQHKTRLAGQIIEILAQYLQNASFNRKRITHASSHTTETTEL